MIIPGLPEGVECVRIGMAGPGDFEITSHNGTVYICQSNRQDSVSQIIVRPMAGYVFVPVAQPNSAFFRVAQQFPEPLTMTCSVTFRVTNSIDRDRVQAALDQLAELPGYLK